MRSLVVMMMIGCHAPPPATPLVEDLPVDHGAESAAAAICITPADTTARIRHAYGDSNQVMYCVGDAMDQCFTVELGSGKLSRLLEAPIAPTNAARVETRNPELKICSGDLCTPLTDKVLPGAEQLHATTNDAGTLMVVLLGDAPSGRGYAEVWDVIRTKRIATFPYARGEYRCGDVSLLGETIYIVANSCNSPAARGALYTQRGYKLANAGGRDFGAYGGATAQVDPTTWAFLDENATKIAVQDVKRGQVKKTIDTTALWAPSALGNPGESALISLGEGKLAVIAGAPNTGSVAIVDVASGKLDITKAPLCPPR